MAHQSVLPQLAKPFQALLFIYGSAFLFAAMSLWLTSDVQGTRAQLALLWTIGIGVGLWLGLLLAKPKPIQLPQRSRYSALEYWLSACVMAVGLVLLQHPGWVMGQQAPSGLLAIAWGLGWVAAWMGPQALAGLTLLLAHWLALQQYLEYRQTCWRWQATQRERKLTQALETQLQRADLLGPKDTQLVARKLALWLLDAHAWSGAFADASLSNTSILRQFQQRLTASRLVVQGKGITVFGETSLELPLQLFSQLGQGNVSEQAEGELEKQTQQPTEVMLRLSREDL